MDPPAGADVIPSSYLYNKMGGELARPMSRVVVQGFYQADTGKDEAAHVASMESAHLLIAIAAQIVFGLKQADIKTAFLHARIPADEEPIYVFLRKGSSVLRNKRSRCGDSSYGSTVCASPRRAGIAPSTTSW